MWLQVLLEDMPASWAAWHERVAATAAAMPSDRIEHLAALLSLPRELTHVAARHAVLAAAAPGRVEPDAGAALAAARPVRYLPACRHVWAF
jgi:hypothetical protein